ncbi:hypothetical protein A2Y85_07940 [candidate division WOR-3 bacterium RBG_13_43_14]|uniref:FlgD/Vpr Ig-like domain-containing protein n=1 Tax=candidate division WOR-3 bacterium RBG_13_43_14 TaxID=1802590 RepID=A0A1F4U8X8_UNCW3|nr:MAG: hypothetical protein A2Y85_07940 [candidate division WOR-3 bacterium RBG_13_43_14]
MDPNNNQVLYSGGYIYTTTYLMSVSKSTDAGATWTRDTLETTVYSTCTALRIDPSNSNLVYAGGYTGFYKSTDAGNNWVKSSTGLTGTVNDIAIDPNNSSILYAGSSSGAFKSTNGGTNWSSTGLTGVTSLAIDVTTSTTIYAGTSSGVYYSTNGGSNWTLMNTGLFNTNISSLGVNHNNYLFTGTDGASMYRWSLAVGMQENSKNIVPMNISCQPNPTKGNLSINYTLGRDQNACLSIYDIQGRQVVELISTYQTAGDHSVIWRGTDNKGYPVPAGVYFCKLITDDVKAIEKIIMIK